MADNAEFPFVETPAHCDSCGSNIRWLKTKSGKRMPVEWDAAHAGDTTFEHGRHVSHFACCPDAGTWRKKRA